MKAGTPTPPTTMRLIRFRLDQEWTAGIRNKIERGGGRRVAQIAPRNSCSFTPLLENIAAYGLGESA
jgi:hypothetical protein